MKTRHSKFRASVAILCRFLFPGQMYGDDLFGPLFTPSPFKGSYGTSVDSPFSEIGLRSPISMPCPVEEAAAAKTDQLSFVDILANYEQMEQSLKQKAVPLPPLKQEKVIRKKPPRHEPATFRPFMSLECVELTVHQLRSLHHAAQ